MSRQKNRVGGCALATAVWLLGCASGAGSGDPSGASPPEPSDPREPTRQLVQLLVIGEASGARRGDTVSVDLADIDSSDRVAVYRGRVRSGRLPLAALGTGVPGLMVVAAERSRVRRCRSRGCSLIGYVARGQVVQVGAYLDLWYEYRGADGTTGYVLAEDLRLPLLERRSVLERLLRRTAAYYARELGPLRVEGQGPLFNGEQVREVEGVLRFEFYTGFGEGPALASLCNAMRGIAHFVEGLMDELPAQLFPAYTAGIFQGSQETAGGSDAMVAGLTGDGTTYCRSP